MIVRFNEINWHDMYLKKVTEITEEHSLIWDVDMDVSEDKSGSEYKAKIIKFIGVKSYSVTEGDVVGRPTILDAEIIPESVMGCNKFKISINTTAGNRAIIAVDIDIFDERT